MLYRNSVEYQDPAYPEVCAAITAVEIGVQTYEDDLLRAKAEQDVLEKVTEQSASILEQLQHVSIEDMDARVRILNGIGNFFDQQGTALSRQREIIRRTAERIRDHRGILAAHYEKRAKLRRARRNEPFVFTKAALKEQLSGVDNLVPSRVACGLMRDQPILRWVYSGIKMRPNENNCGWLYLLDGDNVEVALPDIEVRVNMLTRRFTIRPYDLDVPLPWRWGNVDTPHPHVLSDYEPCFGDFAGPITEALDEYDFRTVATLIQLFLSQADARDSAGKLWARGLIEQHFPQLQLHRMRLTGTSHRVDPGMFFVNGEAYTVVETAPGVFSMDDVTDPSEPLYCLQYYATDNVLVRRDSDTPRVFNEERANHYLEAYCKTLDGDYTHRLVEREPQHAAVEVVEQVTTYSLGT